LIFKEMKIAFGKHAKNNLNFFLEALLKPGESKG